MSDVIALREHLVAEVERWRFRATERQRMSAKWRPDMVESSINQPSDEWYRRMQANARSTYDAARTATDAWLAADARLRALDGLIARCDRLTTGIVLAANVIGARHQLAALEGRGDETARDVLAAIREAM